MALIRIAYRSLRPLVVFSRQMSATVGRMAGPGNAKEHEGTNEYRKIQSEKPLNPHMTNTNSTIANDVPSVGARKGPPELISSVDPNFTPTDSVVENTERMTGGTQKGGEASGLYSELGVGEMEGAKFRVEPLRRTGEDANTTRARLLCSYWPSLLICLWTRLTYYFTDQSRKRGTLESDLLMSTFAEAHLRDMTPAQMAQFDLFLDENDWDIYYWATQEPTPTSQETAEGAGAGPGGANTNAKGTDKMSPVAKGTGEWAQTVGTFKPAYRPVPARWKNSEILAMLRRHVISRSAGGVHEAEVTVGGKNLSRTVQGTGGGGKFSL